MLVLAFLEPSGFVALGPEIEPGAAGGVAAETRATGHFVVATWLWLSAMAQSYQPKKGTKTIENED